MALLKFKRSAVPAKVPSIADLALGELAINTYDGKVYTKKDDGTQAIVEVGGGGGVQTITSSDGSVTVTGTTDINLSVPVTAATNTVLLPVRNNTGATLAKGTAVYINGALGQNPTVTKAIATGDATSAQTLGLVTANIANNAVGNVTLIGSLTNLDTSAYTDGAQLYLSPTTAGALTATKPYAPNHLVYMAVVEHAHPSLGKLFVKVQNGYEMDELHNVAAVSPANNDGLFYNTSTSLWEKKSIVTALGYTPYNATNPAGYITSSALSAYLPLVGGTMTGDIGIAAGKKLAYSATAYITPENNVTGAEISTSGSITFKAGSSTPERLTINASGNVTASVDVRAPIFYDSNDTSYYVNPNGFTRVETLGVVNERQYPGSMNSDWEGGYYHFGPGNDTPTGSYGHAHIIRLSSVWNVQMFFPTSNTNEPFWLRRLQNGTYSPWRRLLQEDEWIGGKYLNSNGSIQASIYYDANDTAAYVDPAGASWIKGGFQMNVASPSNDVFGGLEMREAGLVGASQSAATYAPGINFHWGSRAAARIYMNAAGHFVLGGQSDITNNRRSLYADEIFASNSVRGTIFYDSNNTAYYIDPASTSNLRGLTLTDGSASMTFSSTTSGRSSAFGMTDAYNMYLNAPSGGVLFLSSFQAPIMYDRDNSGYYVDPASTSNLAGLTVANRITGSVSGCTFTQDSQDQDNITLRTDSGFYQSSTGTNAEGWPLNDSGWQHMISCTHTNDGNYFAMQLAAGFFSTGLFYRSVNNNGAQAWSRVALYNNGYAAPLYASIYYDADNTAYYLDAASTGTSLNVAGNIIAAGNVTAYSDIRVKANVETIPSALDKLDQIRGVTYTRTDLEDKEQRYAGVIAQEIEAVLPEAVRDLGNIKAVDYNATIALLIQAVKELRDEVEAFRK